MIKKVDSFLSKTNLLKIFLKKNYENNTTCQKKKISNLSSTPSKKITSPSVGKKSLAAVRILCCTSHLVLKHAGPYLPLPQIIKKNIKNCCIISAAGYAVAYGDSEVILALSSSVSSISSQ